jgi:hypothetical protein
MSMTVNAAVMQMAVGGLNQLDQNILSVQHLLNQLRDEGTSYNNEYYNNYQMASGWLQGEISMINGDPNLSPEEKRNQIAAKQQEYQMMVGSYKADFDNKMNGVTSREKKAEQVMQKLNFDKEILKKMLENAQKESGPAIVMAVGASRIQTQA